MTKRWIFDSKQQADDVAHELEQLGIKGYRQEGNKIIATSNVLTDRAMQEITSYLREVWDEDEKLAKRGPRTLAGRIPGKVHPTFQNQMDKLFEMGVEAANPNRAQDFDLSFEAETPLEDVSNAIQLFKLGAEPVISRGVKKAMKIDLATWGAAMIRLETALKKLRG